MMGVKKKLGYDNLVTVEPVGLSGGLAVLWKKSYKVNVLFRDKRVIDTKVEVGSLSFFLTCVYGDPVVARRKVVWDHLADIAVRRDEAWILTGDFNELMSNEEKLGGAVRSEASFWDFRNMASTCKIRELRSSGNRLSWAGVRDRAWVQCRLDRSFGNDEWFNLFPRAHVEYLKMWASDHRPLLISFSLENGDSSRGRFYFDKRMVGKTGFEEAVRRGWQGSDSSADIGILERIASCRKEMAKWKKSAGVNSRDNISWLSNSLEAEIALLDPDANRMKQLRCELSMALREEELFWRQKSREEWLRAGDLNTSFFHNSVKGKKIKNRVLMLLDEDGVEHFSEGAKGHIATEYFCDLFMSSNPHDLDSLFVGFHGRVSEEMNGSLVRQVIDEEIKRAAFAVKGSSAPGEDGLTGVFYQKFWHIVGPKLSEEIHEFFRYSVLPSGWNHTQISLLPKVSNPTCMKDMMPISLCSVQYKIISKILSERLKACLSEVVSDTQGAFFGGRLSTDNVTIAHELVHGSD